MSYNEELQSNNDALRGILDEVNALPDGTGGVQPDYEQNDPAARDYIKNRPFYDSREWVAVHTEAETSPEGGTPTGQEYSTFTAESPNIFDLYPVGTTVRCVIDGVEYVSAIRENSRIGNYGLVSAGDNTGEPFCLFGRDATIGVCVKDKPAGAYTVSVYALEGELKKIDSQFLPEPVQPDWNQNDSSALDYIKNRPFYISQNWEVACAERDVEFLYDSYTDASCSARTPLSVDVFNGDHPVGTVCKIKIGNDEYIGEMRLRDDGGPYYLGYSALAGEAWSDPADLGPYCAWGWADGEALFAIKKPAGVYKASLSVIGDGVATKIDPKYLPSMEPYVIDSEAYTYGDDALAAILEGRPIYIKVPNKGSSTLYSNFMPVLQYQLPNQNSDYLHLFYLKDGIAENLLAAMQAVMQGNSAAFEDMFGTVEMMLSQSYDECPLKVSPIK